MIREDAIGFIQSCTPVLVFDAEKSTVETRVERVLTECGCGWDEGYDFYYRFHADTLLSAVGNCLANGRRQGQFVLEGVEYYCHVELSGAGDSGGQGIWENPETRPIKAEILIDVAQKKLTLNILNEPAKIIVSAPDPLAPDPCQTCVEKLTGVGGESCLDCHLNKK